MNYLTLKNGKRIAYKFINHTHKDLPLLVFLHEGLGSTKIWKTFPKELSDATGLPALLYDRPGYGDSSDKDSFTDDYLENEAFCVMPEVLSLLGIKNKIIPFGHSDGGTIALLYSGRYPENVLCTISESGHVFFEDYCIKGLNELKEKFETTDLKEKLKHLHKDKTEKLFYNWLEVWLSGRLKDWNIIPLIKNIETPVLIIQGDNDEFGTNKQVFDIINNISTIKEYKILKNTGHIPHLSDKNEVLRLSKQFIGKFFKLN